MQARIGGDEVNANCAPELPEVITVPQSVPARPARLRLLKRMSQATTEVAPSGGDHEVQQEVSRRHRTWVEMIVEDSDNDDKERDNPVESDDDSDCVLDALQRDLKVDVASVCPVAADAPHFGRVAVQATQRQVSESVTKKRGCPCHHPRHEPPNWMERVRLPAGGQQQPHRRTRQTCLKVSCSMRSLWVRQWRGTQQRTIPRVTAPRECVKFHVEDDWCCCRESVVWVWIRRIPSPLQVRPRRRQTLYHRDAL